MKKFFSLIMVLAMVLSLGITAFAAENNGSITITNATIDETYEIYKFFDASISKDADGKTNAVSYSITTDNQFFADLFGADGTAENPFFTYNSNTGSVTKKEGVNDAELIKYLTELVENGTGIGEEAEAVVEKSIRPLIDAGADTIVLGCTHYPFLSDTIRKVAGKPINLIDPAPAVAKHLLDIMQENGLIHKEGFNMDLHSSGDISILEKTYKNLI